MIVIPMAGASSRFAAAGYRAPKFMLPLHGRPVFDYCVASFAKYISTHRFLFVCRDDDATAFARERCAVLGLKHVEAVALNTVTEGQAETVEAGLRAAGAASDEALCIFNIDTFRPNLTLSLEEADYADAAGALEVFKGEGDNWSFVLADPERPGFAKLTTEKQPVSDLCSTGLYEFRTIDLFRDAVERERMAPQAPERYVAPLYNHLIADGVRVGWRVIDASEVIFCGVPAEYEALVSGVAPPFDLGALSVR